MPLQSFADDVPAKMNALMQEASEIQSTEQGIATIHALNSQASAFESDLNNVNSQLSATPSMPEGVLENHDALTAKKDSDTQALSAIQKKLSSLPSLNDLQQKLQAQQKDYNDQKSYLGAPERKEVENNEIELRIALVNQQQKSLSNLKDLITKKCNKMDALVGGGIEISGAVLIAAMGAYVCTHEEPCQGGAVFNTVTGFLSGSFLTAFPAATGLIMTDVACTTHSQKQIDEASASLQSSRDKLQVMLDAYKLTN